MPVDLETLEYLHSLRQAAGSARDWKAAFDALVTSVREVFIYDNVALYLLDARGGSLDVSRARAVGRGKKSEADVSWGEGIAGKVISARQTILQEPGPGPYPDRLEAPFLLGLPIFVSGRLHGVLVFVRFGGPNYIAAHRLLAEWIASVVSSLLESHALRQARSELDSVQRQMRLQEDFVSTISHELRTPLGFIKGYSTSLLREDTKWDDSTQREFLSIIDEETDRLTNLIEKMLESARLQSKTLKFKFQPLRMDALVRDVSARIQAHLPELQVQLELEAVPPIPGDGVQLSQVIENLYSNAIKYAPGAPITVRMSSGPSSLRAARTSVKITFADQGPGIAEDYLPFIFERFYRVPAESSTSGTGLGLYICRQIVQALHGKIWAESVQDRGTTFIIELPIKATD
jgi:signal transduction histidine kinase